MKELASSCELGATAQSDVPRSRIMRFQPDFRWEGVSVAEYKTPADHWCGITRMALVGDRGEKTRFHLRYFEIAPGGYSSLEQHVHEHVVVVLRGEGWVRLGEVEYILYYGDAVYVAPNEFHQFRNFSTHEPFGFLCIVDAERDAPRVGGGPK